MLKVSQDSLTTYPDGPDIIHLNISYYRITHTLIWWITCSWLREDIHLDEQETELFLHFPSIFLPHLHMSTTSRGWYKLDIEILPSDIWPVLWCSSSQSLCSGRSHPWQSWWRHNCSWRWWCQGSHWSHHNISQLWWSSRCLRPWSQDSHIYSSNFPQCQSLCNKIYSENQT